MKNPIDAFLNQITMYRLVLYHLIFLVLVGLLLSVVGWLAFSPLALAFSSLYLTAVCWLTNKLFSKVFEAPTNIESVYITALILALIITPVFSAANLIFLTWVGIWAMASKYIIAINKKHLFNPAALGVALVPLAMSQSASWWIGNPSMLVWVLLGGLLIIRKQRQMAVVSLLIITSLVTIIVFTVLSGYNIWNTLQKTILDSALFFFASIMFTEPLTMPPTKKLQLVYAVLVGILFAPQWHIGSAYSTPEVTLLLGNIFSYIVSPKVRRILSLQQVIQLTPDSYDFILKPNRPFKLNPGQYLEWTLPHPHADGRGNRRYFTIASSPTEADIHIGVKFYEEASSFKMALAQLTPGQTIVGGQLAGDFTLPKDPNQKCVFIAGGIGITPYRSMIQYLLDTKQARPIVVLYAARTQEDFAYWEIFEKARTELGINTIYVSEAEQGMITPELIKQSVPDYTDRLFYVSGSNGMVTSLVKNLKTMRIPARQIKKDFFPGFV